MNINEICVNCLLDMGAMASPAWADPADAALYRRRVEAAVRGGMNQTAPVVVGRMGDIYREMFGPLKDYSEANRRFNALMLGLEGDLQADVDAAPDPLERAVQYAIVGNYIDFAALGDVSEATLREQLARASAIAVDGAALADLRAEAMRARRLAYLTDNSGEIVADKVLLRTLRALNPALEISVAVRGRPIFNDATLDDARQVGLEAVAHRVLGNGSGLPGVVLEDLSPEARDVVNAADLIIAKGQANYEGLCGCGLNVFYIFMCKCRVFMERFGVKQYTGMLIRE